MALLTPSYRSSVLQYRRYLEAVQKRPILQASLFVVMTLMLVILLVIFALRPTLITIAGLYGDYNKQKEIAAKLDARIQSQTKAAQIYNQIQPQLPLLDEAIPSQSELQSWSDRMEKAATDSGVRLASDATSKFVLPKETNGLIINPSITVTAKGSYPNLKTFLNIVENIRRLIKVQTVVISKETNLSNELQMQISGSILFTR